MPSEAWLWLTSFLSSNRTASQSPLLSLVDQQGSAERVQLFPLDRRIKYFLSSVSSLRILQEAGRMGGSVLKHSLGSAQVVISQGGGIAPCVGLSGEMLEILSLPLPLLRHSHSLL